MVRDILAAFFNVQRSKAIDNKGSNSATSVTGSIIGGNANGTSSSTTGSTSNGGTPSAVSTTN